MTYRKYLQYLLLCASPFVLFLGCEILDKPEKIPSYIHIPSITLADNPSIDEGTLSNRIVDAWVYIDDQLVGAFELPCTFPILKVGEQEIMVFAGIYLNGVKTTRVYYPFYTGWSRTVTLVPDSVITLQPEVTYHSAIKLPLHETFELAGVMLEDGTKSLTSLQKTNLPVEVFEGSFAGKIVLNDTDSVYQGVTIQAFELPSSGGNVFLELNYKSDADIIIGLYAIKISQILQLEVAGILPKQEWSKIYINLTPTVIRENDALEFKIFIGSYLPAGKSEATVLIDNLKLIHF